MAKRKQPSVEPEEPVADTPSKRRRRATNGEERNTNGVVDDDATVPIINGTPSKHDTSSRRTRRSAAEAILDEEEQDEGSPTPKVNGRTLFATPRKEKDQAVAVTPSRSVQAKADRSARRKSARLLAEARSEEPEDDGFEEQDTRLARAILEDEEGEEDAEEADPDLLNNDEATTPSKTTPSKRGRPKGRTPKPAHRTPTPEGLDIPPEERYFFQTRPGPPQVSSARFDKIKHLTHDEYVEQISSWKDPHEPETKFLMRLHARSFPQWRFELEEGYGVCLYGFGSKRGLVTRFAEWLFKNERSAAPRIVVVNGYTPKLNIRNVLNTIASAVSETEDSTVRLTGQPEEMLDTLLSHLTNNPSSSRVYLLVNSVDAPSLRRSGVQALLARLSSHPLINFLCTADTPSFATLWTSSHLAQFRFMYHDCTTFAPYDTEIGSVVDEVHDLVGRKRMRVGGKEGIGFVLKSLPENARNLYRLLLSEILTLMDEGVYASVPVEEEDDDDEDQVRTPKKKSKARAIDTSMEEVAVEYRTLYRKASEEFICSSSMNFQFLLKEFLDHQMITSRRDPGSGAEMLGIPLGRQEMEGVLEELI
ncbi:Origin recognition complex subunit 2 [Cladophialophora chaetospira]|uniref:Origin recognition complex subunit 2 n=1 Tax=Cladophialophora chaetospira TaxID=386627 RepID=A0AA38WYC1_9EURO|nr:Origin recognition complex subunit 2 [Cladophialophora chaetospira]